MTLNQLRTFVAVAQAGSVRRAAEQLVVTQPAVSGALRALQESLGVALVEPDGRGLRLTMAGRSFADYARRVLGLLDEAQAAAAHGHDPTQGLVRIAAVTTAGEHIVPLLLADFLEHYPRVQLRVQVGTRHQVWYWMDSREADVALAGRPPVGSGLAIRALAPNKLMLVAAPGLVAGEGPHRVTDLAHVTWLLREEGSGTRATQEALLDAAEIQPPTLTLGSNGAVIAGAAAGLGVTLVSRSAIGRQLAGGELVEIVTEETPVDRPWHAVTQEGPTPTAELFIDHLLTSGVHDQLPFEPVATST